MKAGTRNTNNTTSSACYLTGRLAYYNNVNASWFFLPLIFLFGEHRIIEANLPILMTSKYWSLMFTAGFLGFAIGIVTVMQINYTSPLTHNISGTAKACVQTILALLIWQNATTLNGNIGLAMTIIGSCLYAYVRTMENDKLRSAASSQIKSVANAGKQVAGQDEEEGVELIRHKV